MDNYCYYAESGVGGGGGGGGEASKILTKNVPVFLLALILMSCSLIAPAPVKHEVFLPANAKIAKDHWMLVYMVRIE